MIDSKIYEYEALDFLQRQEITISTQNFKIILKFVYLSEYFFLFCYIFSLIFN